VAALPFEEARALVERKLREAVRPLCFETVPLSESPGRVLGEDVFADRDYPPFPRSARDGFAVIAADVPGTLRVTGEVRAGTQFEGTVRRGESVEIMTGAPLPSGADAVVMVEHTHMDPGFVVIEREASIGDNFNPRGSEVRMGEAVVRRGTRLDYAHVAILAAVGCVKVPVVVRPKVAILATGDEIVPVDTVPGDFQIRNSNSIALAAQIARAGGEPILLPVAPDVYEPTRALIAKGLEADLLLLSGGVSAGKYDIVERVLADMGAEFYFDRIKIQPGQPLVFGSCSTPHGPKFFFGLPGNPTSTMVTFEAIARIAVDLLAGRQDSPLALPYARLTNDLKQKTGLTRFLPACVTGSEVTTEPWRGSGDMAAVARVNAFVVTEPDREFWASGEMIRVFVR